MKRAKRAIAILAAVLVGITSTPHHFVVQAAEQVETYIVYGRRESTIGKVNAEGRAGKKGLSREIEKTRNTRIERRGRNC